MLGKFRFSGLISFSITRDTNMAIKERICADLHTTIAKLLFSCVVALEISG